MTIVNGDSPAAAIQAKTLWVHYLVSLKTRPIYTKSVTAASLNLLQEVVASALTGGDSQVAARKAGQMAIYGGLISGPMGHYLYSLMEKIFSGRQGAGAAIGKLFFSLFVISPIQNAVYLAAMSYIAGANLAGVLTTLRTRLVPMLKMTWVIFPAVQIFAIKYLDQELWVPFFNLVSFVFGTYINVMGKRAKALKK
ncbi:hypothetical protein HKX48_007349 [Thoreauomyces humboldtii]|nr:hypothetical protein HKX48_007349 [Thoreauomyces humboldtii]